MVKDNQVESDLQDMLHIIDDFELIKVLKTSDFEMTELVCDKDAAKYIRKTLYGAASKLKLFNNIKEIASSHLQKVYSVACAGNDLLLICEYVEGQTLCQRIKTQGPFNEKQLYCFVCDLCDALGKLHNINGTCVVHRDVNPNNIIMTAAGACLIDFGIARSHTDGVMRDTKLWGTAGYAAPEQFGFQQTDARTDIYALGQVMRFAASGKDPDKQAHLTYPKLEEIIKHCCAIDPVNRFSSISELKDACDKTFGAACSSAKSDENNKNNKVHSNEASSNKPATKKTSWTTGKIIGFIWLVCVVIAGVCSIYANPSVHSILDSLFMLIAIGLAPWIFICGGFGITKRMQFFQTRRRLKLALCFLAVLVAFSLMSMQLDNAFAFCS